MRASDRGIHVNTHLLRASRLSRHIALRSNNCYGTSKCLANSRSRSSRNSSSSSSSSGRSSGEVIHRDERAAPAGDAQPAAAAAAVAVSSRIGRLHTYERRRVLARQPNARAPDTVTTQRRRLAHEAGGGSRWCVEALSTDTACDLWGCVAYARQRVGCAP